MNLAELFIRRPIMTTLTMLAILVFGIIAYRVLPVSNLPNVDYPTLQVGASLPGASPETMAAAVATPLEREFSTIAGIESMSSVSSQADGNHVAIQRCRARLMPRRRTCRPPSRAPRAGFPPTCRPRPPTRR